MSRRFGHRYDGKLNGKRGTGKGRPSNLRRSSPARNILRVCVPAGGAPTLNRKVGLRGTSPPEHITACVRVWKASPLLVGTALPLISLFALAIGTYFGASLVQHQWIRAILEEV